MVFISDSCHSGTVSRFATLDSEPTSARARFLPPQAYLPEAALRRARATTTSAVAPMRSTELLLAACQDDEFAYDTLFDGTAHGAFTFYANKALQQLNPQSTFRDWMRAVRTFLPNNELPQNAK